MKIFVYGSLKRNKKLHFYLKNAEFLGYAKTSFKYPLILSKSGWYPYMLDLKNVGYYVLGEVYEINYNLLKKLDRLEEVPYYYKRKKICVKIKHKSMEVYTYFFAKKEKFLKSELMQEF